MNRETFRRLPDGELKAALSSDDCDGRIIGGFTEKSTGILTLTCGDGWVFDVPFSEFQPSGDGTAPNFDALAFTDYGHTVALGDYESIAEILIDKYRNPRTMRSRSH